MITDGNTIDNFGDKIAHLVKVKTSYSITDKRYSFAYVWNKSTNTPAYGPQAADGCTRDKGLPWAFNWICRRDPDFLCSGDLPRFALVRRYRIASNEPPKIKLGDLRIRCTISGKAYWLDEADDIRTTFHPWGTEHKVSLKSEVPVDFDIRAFLVENRGIAVRVLTSADSKAPVDAEVELVYGGVCQKGMAQWYVTYFVASPEDSKDNSLTPYPGGITISNPDTPSKVTVMTDPAGEMQVTPADAKDIANRAVFKYKLSLNQNPQTLRLLAFETESPEQPPLKIEDFAQYQSDAEAYYSRLLAPFEIETPDPVLDAGFYTAVVNFDYDYQPPGWLEGVHCWNCYWTNNYQISAAVCLGQFDQARDALIYFAGGPYGPSPGRCSDGTPFGANDADPLVQFEDGLPYYIEQLYRYWQATGDDETVEKVWQPLLKNFEKYWGIKDPEGNILLHYHLGCNSFLYQADHLSLPGYATSPSVIMTDCLEKMANLAEARKDPESAAIWRHRAEYMRSELIRRLWSKEQGKFLACIDAQGLPMQANYYTDFVFPELYSSLPSEYSWICLQTLDRTLWVGDHLMRVGDLKPTLFGNDNVMPVQMAEAAEAYCKAGRSDEGYRLLHGIALGATIYTDSPGSFPERMSDTGFGLSDYVFGNPIASFIRGTVAGLFGIERKSADRALLWHPAIPDEWKSARFKIGDISMSISGAHGNRTYSISLGREQSLDFKIPLHTHRIEKVLDADGNHVPYEVLAHPSGGFIQIHAEPASRHVFHIISAKADTGWKLPAEARSGYSLQCKLPASGMSVNDPQGIFEEFRIDGDTLKAQLTQGEGRRTFFLNDSRNKTVLPVEVDLSEKTKKQEKSPMLPGKRESLNLDDMFNSDVIQSCNMWCNDQLAIDMTECVDHANLLKVGDYTFKVRPSGKNMLLLEVGYLHTVTNNLELSNKPHSTSLHIGKPVHGIELLMVSEFRVRLTRMQVGWVKLHYVDGSQQLTPLTHGQNTGTLWEAHAKGVVYRELAPMRNIYALQVDTDPTRKLESVEIELYAADGSIGLLGANTISP